MGTASPQKQEFILAGYGVNGVAIYVPVSSTPGEIVCPRCEGMGRIEYDNGVDGFSKSFMDDCDQCDGAGVLEIETMEEE